jgi:hypothetical protein
MEKLSVDNAKRRTGGVLIKVLLDAQVGSVFDCKR